MEYIKFTSIIKEQSGNLAGIVSLQKINGENFLDWSLGQLNSNDELIFTLQGGKKLQFSGLAKRGKKKVFAQCSEFRCDVLKGGKSVASGRTSNYIDDNLDVINYVNSFSSDTKQILKENKVDDSAKVEDVFEGKVATYNYYENVLPEEVANDAKAIVQGADGQAGALSKEKAQKNEIKSRQSVAKSSKPTENVENLPNNTTSNAKNGNNKINETDVNDKKPCEQKNDDKEADEKDIRSRKNAKAPTNTYEDFDNMEINKEPYGEPFDSENDDQNNSESDNSNDNDETKKWNNDDATFYESIKEQLDDLFAKFPKDTYLNEIIPSSNWAKVTYDESGRTYSVGILTDGEEVLFIGYGVIADYSEQPPKELNKNAQWVPLNFTKPHGKGYWMLYQSAKDGKNV